jgi:hypothetical protein
MYICIVRSYLCTCCGWCSWASRVWVLVTSRVVCFRSLLCYVCVFLSVLWVNASCCVYNDKISKIITSFRNYQYTLIHSCERRLLFYLFCVFLICSFPSWFPVLRYVALYCNYTDLLRVTWIVISVFLVVIEHIREFQYCPVLACAVFRVDRVYSTSCIVRDKFMNNGSVVITMVFSKMF